MSTDTELPGGNENRRQRERDSLLLVARVRIGDETIAREARVRNLSETGLMAELAKVVEVGTPVTVTLRGIGEVAGTVAWCTEGRMGISLNAPIDPLHVRKPSGAAKPVSSSYTVKASDSAYALRNPKTL
ncbi:PilZ domain-containing protein [Sphingomonas faeni]|uniref:PilZ domain-containing protein n=1 Tax=Sphingomonas faeni TaxID=185950 RepID=A0A2T5TYU5_9SPHN|nr:PilZ domain-containing protein [Sphingomonas faeni]PTW44422.1 PilZ domain-containing protein [Sphingomonas faeni]